MSKTRTSAFNPVQYEEHWLSWWEQQQLFQGTPQASDGKRPKRYLLFAFAYPSGVGLHVGHVESKTALDILARYYRMQGEDVFFPVGWDAFGLPAENYAIKTGVPPVTTTKQAIDTFRRQIKRLGISYDWQNELATCHPGYYKWTQWLFLQLYSEKLAYQAAGMVNWCPSCQTVLANEQVVDGTCERCGTEVIQKEMKQWYFKISQYRDELISGLDQVDWPQATKQQQLNWIGKSQGAQIVFQTKDNLKLEVYTTAHDTIFGCTFMVVAPEHTFLQHNRDKIKNWPEVEKYIKASQKKTEMDRQVQKQKTGVLVEGITFLNPVNGEELPLFVADYVLSGYGTGAIMAVPGHDERDNEFAEKFHLPVIQTAQSAAHETTFIGYDKIKDTPGSFYFINSGAYDGLTYAVGREKMLHDFITKGFAQKKSQYKLRDWLISRQRYWGAPIPIVYDPEGQPHPVKAEHLPWLLPTDVEFKPTGESPLTHSKEFIARTEKLYGKGWRPEFDTMDTFVDSSWYYLRYTDARNEAEFASKQRLERWLPVDFYMIGPEHIVLHLLYSRFFTKFLRDQGYLQFDEPFLKMRHQGMILGPDGKKMSKSKGNVINPDDVVEKFGADTLRMYEMFMGPIEADKPWDVSAVAGVYRFLSRVHALVLGATGTKGSGKQIKDSLASTAEATRALHQLIQKIGDDIPRLKFNTAIAAMMSFLNVWEKSPESLSVTERLDFVKVLAPFAPFLAEELYQQLQESAVSSGVNKSGEMGEVESVHLSTWPTFNPELIVEPEVTIGVQVNGKLRGEVCISQDIIGDEKEVITLAQSDQNVAKWLKKARIIKTIYIPGKILNFVVQAQ